MKIMPICARCAALYPTCCRMNPAEARVCFPLSKAEAARLAPYAAQEGIPAGAPMENNKDFVRILRRLFPDRQKQVQQSFPIPGEHLILPTSRAGQCLFLHNDGCLLPREARPWYCRLFPLWFREGRLELFAAHQCLITREAPGARQALKSLNSNAEQALELYEHLCRDWGLAPAGSGCDPKGLFPLDESSSLTEIDLQR